MQYKSEIQKLKELQVRSKLNRNNTAEYKKYMEAIKKKYSISAKTIYRDMRKKNPMVRKIRSDRGIIKSKPSIKESKMIKELIKAGKKQKELKEIIGNKKGKKISYNKIKRIKENVKNTESNFGKKFADFIVKYFDLDKVAENIRIKMKEYEFTIYKEDMEDIQLILKNAYNRLHKNNGKNFIVSREEKRRMMLEHLIENQITLAKDSGDYKMIESITRMQERIKEDFVYESDFAVFEKCCRELKPEITREEIIALIKRNN